ncbi:hypothetical protein J1N35_001133 [Gossypium stocksii]|uniref:Uncharacterized protein n=1 Tax=Gossypium stocksii TaxID=47602 RepID=A0A9D3WJ61_9ROSI|nr:hypothetical protein J1N35_001133 [Gossypium stocksii]
MATVHSVEFDSKPHGSSFSSDRVVYSFPRHDIHLILAGYGLVGFLDGSTVAPPWFIQGQNDVLMLNPAFSAFSQQDNLLTSWLLSTIGAAHLPSFMDVKSTSDMWITTSMLFATDTDAKQSRLRHDLHSLKKGNLSI